MLCRRPAPPILFTAIAATVVILPWAIDGLPGARDEHPSSGAPLLVQQPLSGLGGGETIREIHQATAASETTETSAPTHVDAARRGTASAA